MNLTIEDALTALRSADPAASIRSTDDAVSGALRGVIDSPPDTVVLWPEPRQPRRRTGIALVAATVLAVAGAGVALAVVRGNGPTKGANGHLNRLEVPVRLPVQIPPAGWVTSPTATAPPDAGGGPAYQAAASQVQEILSALPVLPGAVEQSHPTAPDLVRPYNDQSEPPAHGVRYWTASVTLAEAMAFFESNPPDGLTMSYHGGGGGGSAPNSVSMGFGMVPDSSEVDIMIDETATGVALSALVKVNWIVTKPRAELIGQVTSVDVTLGRSAVSVPGPPPSPGIAETLTGASAQRLADLIDARPLQPPGTRMCAQGAPLVDYLTFHTGDRTIQVMLDGRECNGMTVTIDGAAWPRLDSLANLLGLDRAIVDAIGLPATYAYH